MAIAAEQLRPGREQSAVDHVVEEIIARVRRGELVPGQRLVASDLADAFGVSRAPVREALHVLSGEGVVRLVPNRGAVIARLTTKELLDFIEFTSAICALGMQHAAQKMDREEHREAVRVGMQAIEEAGLRRNADQFIDSLYRYHRTINEIAGNTFLVMFYSRPYFAFYNRLLADFIPGSQWEEYLEHYRSLTAALLAGTGRDPAKDFENHMRWASELLAQNAE
ncbi:GntR family transcriptional regulator [Pseudohaliea sp.]|uniref:GntR family transcriptional regulator n=1 Tax=Pseudohaliea sp. TaxID=2740289 RepID=UPI0032F0021E